MSVQNLSASDAPVVEAGMNDAEALLPGPSDRQKPPEARCEDDECLYLVKALPQASHGISWKA